MGMLALFLHIHINTLICRPTVTGSFRRSSSGISGGKSGLSSCYCNNDFNLPLLHVEKKAKGEKASNGHICKVCIMPIFGELCSTCLSTISLDLGIQSEMKS